MLGGLAGVVVIRVYRETLKEVHRPVIDVRQTLRGTLIIHLTSPHLTSPHLTSPHLTSPHLTSPHLTADCYRHPETFCHLQSLDTPCRLRGSPLPHARRIPEKVWRARINLLLQTHGRMPLVVDYDTCQLPCRQTPLQPFLGGSSLLDELKRTLTLQRIPS
ncbi:uncharacterized protein MYCFIDRAFT_177405 [Pseudocercospora fijiensis CIRAD86]|uniref:Uncharacterized protein n=1 Tax=Pseudocercospora fijiensis (strain CIRAD86) TaxID=383855 RepID=M2ZMX3_PSEFD|nr:uncharacterized protein MYCFIDRAFT_177405 [Pseudocercospora fijiensis CIRAD86]EME80464.1 hypothetical protein MYCFIDRAFT_177405 [Pseudocercospora fijiensis CIRAD86]